MVGFFNIKICNCQGLSKFSVASYSGLALKLQIHVLVYLLLLSFGYFFVFVLAGKKMCVICLYVE